MINMFKNKFKNKFKNYTNLYFSVYFNTYIRSYIRSFLDLFKRVDNEYYTDYLKPIDVTPTEYHPKIEKMEYIQPEYNGKPYILIMDDFKGMARLIKDELHRIQCCDVYNNFNIMMATGDYAAFTVQNFLTSASTNVLEKTIDIAILDITLGGVINNIEYDGIDIAIMIKNKYPNCIIRFLTGHTLNRHNPAIFKFIKKFEDYFRTPIDEEHTTFFMDEEIIMYKHIINKNGNRVACLGNQIQEYFTLQKALKD